MIRNIETRFGQRNKEACVTFEEVGARVQRRWSGSDKTAALRVFQSRQNSLKPFEKLVNFERRGMGAGPAVASLNRDLPGALAVEAVTANQRYNPECESQSSGEP